MGFKSPLEQRRQFSVLLGEDTLIRADGKDILSVKMHLNSELAEKDAEVVTPEIGSEDLLFLRQWSISCPSGRHG